MDHPMEGVSNGPIGADSYKRAVYRSAPSRFIVEMLSPIKQGGSYSYGMRISPVTRGDRSSMSSDGSYSDYEVWRRWEDCLAFQGTLELEYRRMARAKRQRLLRGKGVKRDGFYKQDQASSWESLPPGPDPNSVARDIHDYLPTLTKKGTVFRASQTTIDQRAKELKALVDGLWTDDVPALLDELRNDRIIRDFFGYWRRDYELANKEQKQRSRSDSGTKSRTSVTSSIFSMYFSSSTPSVQDIRSYPESIATSRSTSTRRAPTLITSISERNRKISTDSSDGSPSSPRTRRRAFSTGSSNPPPSTPSDGTLDSPVQIHVSVPEIVDDASISFDYDPRGRSELYTHERPSSALAVLPEGREVSLKRDGLYNPPPITGRRRKSSAGDSNSDRHGMIFLSPPATLVSPSVNTIEEQRPLPDRTVRESWQTMDSSILEGMDLSLPTSPTDRSYRASTSSIATFMTDCSAEGVLPRSPGFSQSSTRRYPTSPNRSRYISGPVSICEFDNDWSDPEEDILDTFLAESFPLPCFDIPQIIRSDTAPVSRPETPIRSHYPKSAHSFSPVPTSPAKSATFSVSTSATTPDRLSIKAGYNDSFVVLRVSCEISYKDLRQRLYNKFVGQEGVPLSDSFTISFLQPTHSENLSNPPQERSPSEHGGTHMYPVTSEADWENAAASIEGSKLTLRIFDQPASS